MGYVKFLNCFFLKKLIGCTAYQSYGFVLFGYTHLDSSIPPICFSWSSTWFYIHSAEDQSLRNHHHCV